MRVNRCSLATLVDEGRRRHRRRGDGVDVQVGRSVRATMTDEGCRRESHRGWSTVSGDERWARCDGGGFGIASGTRRWSDDSSLVLAGGVGVGVGKGRGSLLLRRWLAPLRRGGAVGKSSRLGCGRTVLGVGSRRGVGLALLGAEGSGLARLTDGVLPLFEALLHTRVPRFEGDGLEVVQGERTSIIDTHTCSGVSSTSTRWNIRRTSSPRLPRVGASPGIRQRTTEL